MTRNSDVNEAINQALEVAPQTFARVDSAASGDKAAIGGVSLELKEPTDTELRQDAPAVHSRFHKEVASPESSTAQTGTTGMAAKASVDVPEEIEVADQGKANPRIGSLRVGNEGGEILADSPLCHLESLADFNDEGETGWNAQRRNDIAKKMQRIAAGGYNSVDKLIGRVEELAEVGQ